MKKKFILLASALILFSMVSQVSAKSFVTNDVSNAIKLYKSKNYSQCYTNLQNVIKKDPTNALAYYYMAMASAQLGKADEAVQNYDKVISLTSNNSNIRKYAEKGKRCIESPDNCQESVENNLEEAFIYAKSTYKGLSEKAQGEYERLKIENMMREINRSDDIPSQKFNEYKDFSKFKSDATIPTNDEIVSAIRTLQRANMFSSYSDLSMFSNLNSNNYGMLNGMGNLNSKLLETMLSNNMNIGL